MTVDSDDSAVQAIKSVFKRGPGKSSRVKFVRKTWQNVVRNEIQYVNCRKFDCSLHRHVTGQVVGCTEPVFSNVWSRF